MLRDCTADRLAHLPWRAVPGVPLLANFENGKLFLHRSYSITLENLSQPRRFCRRSDLREAISRPARGLLPEGRNDGGSVAAGSRAMEWFQRNNRV